jgi:hypothetical protein
VKKLMQREKLSVLPGALARATMERALEALSTLSRVEDVRERIATVNAEISRANRAHCRGPPTTLSPLVGEAWRRRRGES